ncbi:hypothetical protein QVD17_38536 [Tagetes erecta]|uniref:TPL/SMU1 LisH-like dimerisation domain-containing protein n=1 Tax=Tagetes erecta TaxID=13708 RepID=A0AAD8JLZ6_TARER|nr:hypothetical protein QVD17_38536 [Tagetes erecta]
MLKSRIAEFTIVKLENESYVAHINSYLRDDPSTNALFELARDGVLLWMYSSGYWQRLFGRGKNSSGSLPNFSDYKGGLLQKKVKRIAMSSLSRELVFLILQFLDEEKFKETLLK